MDTAPEDAESLPGETPRQAAQRTALAGLRQMREAIMKGRDLPPRADVQPPLDWDLHERRLLAMEEIIRTGTTPADGERFEELEQEFFLDYHADMARLMASVNKSMVRNFDEIAAKVEAQKFEVPSEARDAMDDLLLPYQDFHREKMLGELPIETRRQLEEEARRQRDDGESEATDGA